MAETCRRSESLWQNPGMSQNRERRREPRLRLRVSVTVEGMRGDGNLFRVDTKTFDVSPSGAGIELPWPIPIGSILEVTAERLGFAARAIVRHNMTDRSTTNSIVGLEFLDGKRLQVVDWP